LQKFLFTADKLKEDDDGLTSTILHYLLCCMADQTIQYNAECETLT